MKLKKSTFYIAEGQPGSGFSGWLRKEWPCLMVPGSQFAIWKNGHPMRQYAWTVGHVLTGRSIRGEIDYTFARQALERLEAANIPFITLDGNTVKPDGVAKLCSAAIRGVSP